MATVLRYLPKPLLDDIVANQCVPFVGAGFSRNANVSDGKSMPLWEDLGRSLADEIPGHGYVNALDAISAYEHEYSRPKLVEQLINLLHIGSAQPGHAHAAFARVQFELVCTSNLDFLLERAYEAAGRVCRPIVDEDQLSIGPVGSSRTLVKFHGDLHHLKQAVLTEDDYSAYMHRHPLMATFVSNILIGRTALFLGYSLDDPDFRLLWQVVAERLGRLRRLAYTIRVNSPPYQVARFERRGVRVINIPGSFEDYPEILTTLFNEIYEY